jgi:receptor protein-tyrosine kinase/non-specific protein-tyrosine kinase
MAMSRIEKALEKATRSLDNRSVNEVRKKVEKKDITGAVAESPYVITLKEPASPISEEYRKLKSLVVKLTKKGGFKNTLMVTSSLGREGKSITAINLAITLSQEYDHTALLVDADIRNPSLQGYLNITSEVGLTDCLVDGLDIGDAIVNVGGGLTFLPSGKEVKNPSDLLSSKRMRELVDEMKHRYSDRYIIIDTPPVLPFAETFSIGSMVDGTVFVVKEGMAPFQSISGALDILKDSNVFGIVYNDVKVENLYGHYNYYYNYYRYAK